MIALKRHDADSQGSSDAAPSLGGCGHDSRDRRSFSISSLALARTGVQTRGIFTNRKVDFLSLSSPHFRHAMVVLQDGRQRQTSTS
jgi:hypothetical protein